MNAHSAWMPTIENCIQRIARKWPDPPVCREPPSPGGQAACAGFLYSGNVHETVPKRLLLDNRLTPLERNAWQVFRLLLDKEGFAVPRYQDLQPYLSMVPYGERASKETVARVLTILRLTCWLSLVTRGRDAATGRIQGSLYILHDEPVSPAEALQIDEQYADLVAASRRHANKSVRLVAQGAFEALQAADDILPSRLDVLAVRVQGRMDEPDRLARHRLISGSDSEPGQNRRVRNEFFLGSDSEPGKKSLVRNADPPGSESEPGSVPYSTKYRFCMYRTVLRRRWTAVARGSETPAGGTGYAPKRLVDAASGGEADGARRGGEPDRGGRYPEPCRIPAESDPQGQGR